MKTLILILSMILSTVASADNARFTVSPFRGELSITPRDIIIESMTAKARIQFCNIWGSTCAGGPFEESHETLRFRIDRYSNLISFELNKSILLDSTKPLKRFSSCKLSIKLLGKNSKGERFEGYISLIHENDKYKCESSLEMREAVEEALKEPLKVNFSKLPNG
jgi:hypothetical protein